MGATQCSCSDSAPVNGILADFLHPGVELGASYRGEERSPQPPYSGGKQKKKLALYPHVPIPWREVILAIMCIAGANPEKFSGGRFFRIP